MVQGRNFNIRDRILRESSVIDRTQKKPRQNSITSRYVKLNIPIKTEDRAFTLKIYNQVFYKIIDRKKIFL